MIDDWLTVLDDQKSPASDAMTILAWSEKTKMPFDRTSLWLRTGLEQGWVERATVVVEALNGIKRKIIGFRLVKKPGGKNGGRTQKR